MAEQLDANQRFAIRLRRLREARGWPVTELARRAHVRDTYLIDVERGRVNATLDKGAMIAAALEVDLEDMIAPLASGELS